MEVFENAEKGENRLFEEEEIEKKTKAYKKKKAEWRSDRRVFSCISFWIAACWMIGLKSLLT